MANNRTFKSEKLIPKKPWITQQILVLIKERNNHRKKGNCRQYQRTNIILAMKCRKVKKIWTKDVAEDFEDKTREGRMDSAYNIVKLILF